MAPEGGRRGGSEVGEGDIEGRDLLVGRPEGGAADRPTAEAAGSSAAPATSPQPDAHDDAIREILATVRASAARIDALQGTPGPEHETAEALARQTAALTQAVEDRARRARQGGRTGRAAGRDGGGHTGAG